MSFSLLDNDIYLFCSAWTFFKILNIQSCSKLRHSTPVNKICFVCVSMEMEDIFSILIQHGGRWNSSGRYVDFQMEGIIYDSRTLYDGLLKAIALQLCIDTNVDELEIKYIISDRCPPMCIRNDVGVRVYLDQKRIGVDFFLKHPLCITLRSIDTSENGECGIIVEQTDGPVEAVRNVSEICSNNSIRLFGMDPVENDTSDGEDIVVIIDAKNVYVEMKQVYKNKNILVEVMRQYGIVHRFSFRVVRSSSTCYYLVCHSRKCSWVMNASCLNGSGLFKIRKFCGKHTCSVRERAYARRQGISDVVAVLILDKFIDPKTIYTPRDIVADMLKFHGVKMTYMQGWRAKDKAIKMIRGDPAESYARIPGYLYVLEKYYPGSVVGLEITEENKFLYAFVALEASIRAWEYCRPVVVVDGAALKCTHGGTMLIASTLDPGGHILPLAYSIVDSENDASWTWFFEKFREAFGERHDMCFVSDRNESIWKGTSRIYPSQDHHACIWHLWCNAVKKFHKNLDELRKLFFAMAKAYTIQEFEELMSRVDTIDKRIRGYLFGIGYHKWSRAHSTVKRTWTMTSNIAESVNNINRLARRLPVVSLLDFMRITIQTWIVKRSDEAENTMTDLTKKYNVKLEESNELSNSMTVIPSTQFLHTVTDGPKRYIVCLMNRKCSCGRFQLDEIPCGHAMAVLRYRSLHGEDYCSPYYSKRNFQDAYAIPVEPLPCESTWEIPKYIMEPKVLPPDYKRPPGRPAYERRKSFIEDKLKRAKVTCSRCNRAGHNKKSCSYPSSKK